MPKKLNNKIIDEKLKNRYIQRIEKYINSRTKIDFQCLICYNIWKSSPSSIINGGTGCPKCSDKKFYNKIIDEKLKTMPIKRIGEYINNYTKIKFQCLNDNCLIVWTTTPRSIINFDSGCPKCAGNKKLSNKILDERIYGRSIKRIGNYINNRTKINFQCLICYNVWKSAPYNIINGTGCPKCSDKRLTNKTIDKSLKDLNIKRKDNYINNYTKINFQCLICWNTWKASPSSILNNKNGCPSCKNKNERIINTILKENKIIFEHQKSFKDLCLTENKNYRFDFYIPNNNLIIEYNGNQHYTPVKFGNISQEKSEINFKNQQARDEYGRNFCKENNINLIEIDGREFHGEKLKKYIEILIKNNFNFCV